MKGQGSRCNGKAGLESSSRYFLTPEGVRVATRSSTDSAEVASCAQSTPTAVLPSSGHIYRTVDLLTVPQIDALIQTSLHWMLPIGVVTRDGRGREEAAR
jgi:hypothetical protein